MKNKTKKKIKYFTGVTSGTTAGVIGGTLIGGPVVGFGVGAIGCLGSHYMMEGDFKTKPTGVMKHMHVNNKKRRRK